MGAMNDTAFSNFLIELTTVGLIGVVGWLGAATWKMSNVLAKVTNEIKHLTRAKRTTYAQTKLLMKGLELIKTEVQTGRLEVNATLAELDKRILLIQAERKELMEEKDKKL